MTEQQLHIEKDLLALAEIAGSSLEIFFMTHEQSAAKVNAVSEAFKKPYLVYLLLVEPKYPNTPNGYDSWAEPIVRAYEFLDELQKERFYDTQNPDFFKAIKSKLLSKIRIGGKIHITSSSRD